MTDTVVVEGQVKLRDGKKWRNRWVVLRKPSPVADCLSLLVYKDKAERHKGHRERSCLTLGDICGLEPGLSYEGVGYTLAIVSLTQSVLLGFDRRENLLAWDLRIRYSLGEAHRFNVHVLPGTKLDSGPATLHLCNNLLVITRDLPPVVAGQWKLSDLRRYGAVPNGFVFEGGTRCGSWAGVFFLACAEGEQISFLFDCIVRGISPSRSPFGLRPVLPDASSSSSSKQCSSEERIQQEAIELEKRLSRLSTCSRQSSTASTCSYSTSTAGDDCSISSSSSEASHSDASLGSRLTLWAEPSKCPTPSGLSSSGAVSRMSTPIPRRTLTPSLSADDHLYAAVMSGTVGPAPPLRPSSSTSLFRLERARGLQDAGRQSSTDSGIATTGSHSSYSGSFSSYTGSLDMATGEAEDFGSLLSLPSTPSLAPTITSLSHTALEPISSPCSYSCPVPTPITPAPTPVPCSLSGSEYQVPPSPGELEQPHQQPPQLRDLPCYDTPRRLLVAQGAPTTDSGAALSTSSGSQDRMPGLQETLSEPSQSLSSPPAPEASSKSSMLSLAGSLKSLLAPTQTPPPTVPNTCPVCRTAKCNHLFDTTYITPEQWLSARKKCFTQTTPSSQHSSLPPSSSHVERIPGQMPALSSSAAEYLANLQLAQGTPELDDRGRYELMGSYAQLQRTSRDSEASFLVRSPFFISPPRLHRQASVSAEAKGNYERMALTSEVQPKTDPPSGECGAALPAPMDSRMSPFDRFLGDNVNYVNIPISPAARRQIHYMELDLPDLPDTAAAVRGGGSTKYAQIDIAATEAAQRVGAQHAQGREERLQELEQRKRGTNN